MKINLRLFFQLFLAIVLFAVICFRSHIKTIKESYNTENNDEDDDDDDADGNEEKRDIFDGRRIRSFEREGIVIPDRSIDSRECDDFTKLQQCNVSDGYIGCFECIESRYSLRVCVHINEPIRILDEQKDQFITLPSNTSITQGYCLREKLARDIKAATSEESSSSIREAKRQCSAYNADWILVRKRTDGDSSYNFACRCRYPHLMTNVNGPLSACSLDVACNGHGHLDEESRSSRANPFVDGRCECENGWISERDESNGVGPLCREATFAEWPSAFLKKRRHDDIELYSDEIDRSFRVAIEYARRDIVDNDEDQPRKVWLPNPCGKCELLSSPNGTYFCGDRLETYDKNGKRGLLAVHLGVRRTKDYLRNNGGRLPNACVTFEKNALWGERSLSQFMSQDWNDGTMHAQEVGFFVDGEYLQKNVIFREIYNNNNYKSFQNSLLSPKNAAAIPSKWYVVWTYNHYELREHRAKICQQLLNIFSGKMTDLCYSLSNNSSWYDYAFFNIGVYKVFYKINPDRITTTADPVDNRPKNLPVRYQFTYKCPDLRGLSGFIPWRHGDKEITEQEAERIARSMLPICMTAQNDENNVCYYRPELNANHDNPTACVMYDTDKDLAIYAYSLWYPEDMEALRFVENRNVSFKKKRCPGDE